MIEPQQNRIKKIGSLESDSLIQGSSLLSVFLCYSISMMTVLTPLRSA